MRTVAPRYLRGKIITLGLCLATLAALALWHEPALPATAELHGDAETAPLIVVDAGPGGGDGGSVGQSGTVEAGLNLEMAQMLRDELQARGLRVVMTREDENALGDTKREDMRERGRILNTEGATLCVSVHMNAFSDRSASGPMAFYMKGSKPGQALAECVIASVCESVEHPLRRANPGDYFVIRECVSPAVLVECGFLSNAREEALLSSHAYREKLAEGICKGILRYLETAQSTQEDTENDTEKKTLPVGD